MKAGRELDALVAEKIRGERLLFVNRAWSTEDWLTTDHPTEQNVMAIITDEKWRAGASYPHHLVIPLYSVSLEAMWLVIDEMYRRGFWCQMRTPFQAGADGDGFWAGFTPHGTTGWNGKPDHWTSAETMPHAICLAALKASGETQP